MKSLSRIVFPSMVKLEIVPTELIVMFCAERSGSSYRMREVRVKGVA